MMVEEETMGSVEIGNRLFSIPVSEKPHFFLTSSLKNVHFVID